MLRAKWRRTGWRTCGLLSWDSFQNGEEFGEGPSVSNVENLVLHNLPPANQRCLLTKIYSDTRAVRTFNNRPNYSFLDSASGQEVHADTLAHFEYAFSLFLFGGHGEILTAGF